MENNLTMEKKNFIREVVVSSSATDILRKDGLIACDHDLLKEIIFPEFIANEYCKLSSETEYYLCRFDKKKNSFILVDESNLFGIKPLNDEQDCVINSLLSPHISILSINGIAGSGKTIISMLVGLMLLRHKKIKKVFLTKPPIGLSGKDAGTLPGSEKQKLAPFMRSFNDARLWILNNVDVSFREELRNFFILEAIDFLPLYSVRGRTLDNVFIILDEAQNMDILEMKTILTRIGKGTKIVVLGDLGQIDRYSVKNENNGFKHLIQKLKDQHIYSHINLSVSYRSEAAQLVADLL